MKTKVCLLENAALLESLQCYLMPGNQLRCIPSDKKYYKKAYTLWRRVMINSLRHESAAVENKILFSDDFVTQQEIAVLFYRENPVGIIVFNWADLSCSATRQHSYFVNYPRKTLQKLLVNGHHYVMTMSQLMIHPDWRRSKIGPGISELLIGFAVKRFQMTESSALVTFARNNRKTNDTVCGYGGHVLHKNHTSHGLDSDIIAIYKDTIKFDTMPGVSSILQKLWDAKHEIIKK